MWNRRNIGVEHGAWGEQVAAERLRLEGLVILDRNVRPYRRDQRLEIDIIAFDRAADCLIFVEVKQHASHSERERRLRSVDNEKMRRLRIACNAWRRRNHWQGSYRFDVIEVYGTPESGSPEVDHIRRVNLFSPSERFVSWE